MDKTVKDNVITIDGPAGSGKSTIAKLLSKRLGLTYVDTGATYRTLTLIALENNIDPEDAGAILEIAKKSSIELDSDPDDINQFTRVKLNGRDITEEIRSESVGLAVSVVSKLPEVRKYLVGLQREIAGRNPSVLEGRDTGSVVFPDAILKIYLTAGLDERVKRRQKQNSEKRLPLRESGVKKEIEKRDSIDSSRKASPLIVPDDAVIIDGTDMSIEETYDKIKNLYYERIQLKN
ncbi:MAG: (d)CMP kinase [Actinobacteria bacterium]|nr:(d)CMP kinase [Actinomycetota bacterium]